MRTNGVQIVGLADLEKQSVSAEIQDYKMIQDNQTFPFRHAARQQVNFPTLLGWVFEEKKVQ